MSRLGEILLDEQPPVRAMIVWNCNPLVIVPNAEKARDGMARDDLFTVVHEQFLTDTAKYADIVLPATTHIEASDVTPAWGHLWMGWNEAAIEPLGEAVSNSECFRRIASAMGLTEPSLFDDDMTVLKAALPTVDLDALRRDGWIKVPFPADGTPWADGGFPTESGKVEFVSARARPRRAPAHCPTFIAVRRRARGSSSSRPLPAAADDTEAPHALPELRLLAPPQARARRGRPVRRARRRRRRPHAGSPRATARGCSTTAPRSSCR